MLKNSWSIDRYTSAKQNGTYKSDIDAVRYLKYNVLEIISGDRILVFQKTVVSGISYTNSLETTGSERFNSLHQIIRRSGILLKH